MKRGWTDKPRSCMEMSKDKYKPRMTADEVLRENPQKNLNLELVWGLWLSHYVWPAEERSVILLLRQWGSAASSAHSSSSFGSSAYFIFNWKGWSQNGSSMNPQLSYTVTRHPHSYTFTDLTTYLTPSLAHAADNIYWVSRSDEQGSTMVPPSDFLWHRQQVSISVCLFWFMTKLNERCIVVLLL